MVLNQEANGDLAGGYAMKFRESKLIGHVVGILALLGLALPVALYARIGFHTRYMADDFWTAGYLRTLGFWEAQRYWYLSWSGRFSFTFSISLVELLGVKAVTWMPLIALLIWWIGLNWLFTETFRLARLSYRLLLRQMAVAMTLYVTLRSLEYWQQAILWQTGILTYTLPLIAMTFWFAWFLHQLNNPETTHLNASRYLLTVIWFCFIGGLSETSLAMQVSLVVIAILTFRFLSSCQQYRKKAQGLLGAAFVGSLLALMIMGFAPGTAVRAGQITSPTTPAELWDLLSGSFYIVRYFLQHWMSNHIRPAICALLIPGMVAFFLHPRPSNGWASRKIVSREVKNLLFFQLGIFLVCWSCFIPAYYIMRSGPPHRAAIVPQFLVVVAALISSYLLGIIAKRFFHPLSGSMLVRICAVIILAGLLYIGPLQAAWKLWHDLPQFHQFAIEWDMRDQILQQAQENGLRHVTVPGVRDLFMLGEVTPYEDGWINQAVARYYGVESVVILQNP